MKITVPGIFPDVPEAEYYADSLLPTKSFTQSMAKILLEKSPYHAWWNSPWNPDYQPTDNREPWLDIGNIAHKLLLGRGKEIAVVDAENWMTKAAKEERAEYAKIGILGVLPKHYNKAMAMHMAAREQLALRRCSGLFVDGDAEACLAWKEGGIWLRQLVDWISADRNFVVDYKTTGESAAPDGIGRKLIDWGWHIQAAMAERGLDNLELSVGRRTYLWICQETDPPYQLTVNEIDEDKRTFGRWELGNAIDRWRWCVETNYFPGYPLRIEHPELPPWHSHQMLEQQIERDNGIPSDILAAG